MTFADKNGIITVKRCKFKKGDNMLNVHKAGFSLKDGIMASVHNERYLMEQHIHQYSELIYVFDGCITVITGNKKEFAQKGDIAIIQPYQPHAYYTELNCKVNMWMLLFSNSLITDLVHTGDIFNRYENSVFTPTQTLKNFIEARIIDTKEKPVILNDKTSRKLKALLYPIFDEYMNEVPLLNEYKKNNSHAITLTLQYMAQHFHENISLSDVCKAIGYSKSHISHILSEMLSVNFKVLLNSFRISYARNLLVTKNMKSFNIALESGFGSERTFHRAFRESMGITPNEYRKIHSKKSLSNQKYPSADSHFT